MNVARGSARCRAWNAGSRGSIGHSHPFETSVKKIKEHIFDKFYPDIDFSGFEAKMKMLEEFYSTANVFCKVFECGHWHLIHYRIRPIVAAWMIKDNAHTELKDADDNVVVTAEDLKSNGAIGWS